MSSGPEGVKKDEKRGPSTKTIVLIILITVIVCGTAIAAILLLRENDPAPTPSPISGIPVTEENVREIGDQIQDMVDRSMFETYYSSTWRFPDGSSPASSFLMGNSAGNNYPFYFTLTIAGESEPIFTSGILPLGTQIGEVVLDRDLDAGTYRALCDIHMIDENGEEIETNMGFEIALIIEN